MNARRAAIALFAVVASGLCATHASACSYDSRLL